MNDDLTRHLDGEIPLEALEGDARREAEAWDRLLSAFRVEEAPGGAPPWIETRVMAEIEALPEPGLGRRFLDWLVNPQPVRVSPLWAGVATAAVAVALLLPTSRPGQNGPLGGTPGVTVAGTETGSRAVVYVQFVLEAPGAASVVVAGDFDGWEGSHALSDPDGDGTWSGRVPVQPGVHTYMFLVDGSDWITDPRAERYSDDGFGNRNAVLAVAGPAA